MTATTPPTSRITASDLAAADSTCSSSVVASSAPGVALDAVTRGLRVGSGRGGGLGWGQVRADQHPGARWPGRPPSDRCPRRRRAAPGARSAAGPHGAAPRSTGPSAGPAHRRSGGTARRGCGTEPVRRRGLLHPPARGAPGAPAAPSARRAAAGPVGRDGRGDRGRPAVRGPGRRRSADHRRGADGDGVRHPGPGSDTGSPAGDRGRTGERDSRRRGRAGHRGRAGGPGRGRSRCAPGSWCSPPAPSCPTCCRAQPGPATELGPAAGVRPPGATAQPAPGVDGTGAARGRPRRLRGALGSALDRGHDARPGRSPTGSWRPSTTSWPGRSPPMPWRAPSPVRPRWVPTVAAHRPCRCPVPGWCWSGGAGWPATAATPSGRSTRPSARSAVCTRRRRPRGCPCSGRTVSPRVEPAAPAGPPGGGAGVVLEHLLQRYGSEAEALIEAIRRRPELGRPLPGAEDYLGRRGLVRRRARGCDPAGATCSPGGPGSRWRPGTAAPRRRPVSRS